MTPTASPRFPLSRRHLLGGGILLGAGWATAQLIGHRGLASVESPFLGSSARQTLEAVFEALLPAGVDAVACTEDVDAFLAAGDPVMGQQLALGLNVLEHWSGFGLFTFTRFTRMSIDQRLDVLDEWAQSGYGLQRQIAAAVRKVVLFTWYAKPESWEAIGYDGPLVGR